MKKFIHKTTAEHGTLVLDTPIEVHVRISGSPALWTGTQGEFAAEWSPDITPEVTPQVDDVAKPYNYFVSFVSGGQIGNCALRRTNPVSSMADLKEIELEIKETNNLTTDVGVLNFRVFDEPFPALDWATAAYPAIRRILDEIRLVPDWAGYFEPQNREQLERLADYVAVGIQEKNETGVVADLVTGAEKINPGAADKG
jgi:hypothetical protein